jgi:hypothetical protein
MAYRTWRPAWPEALVVSDEGDFPTVNARARWLMDKNDIRKY